MFVISAAVRCIHKGRKERCRGWVRTCEDGCMLKAGPTAGHVAITSGSVGIWLAMSGRMLYSIKHSFGVLGFLMFSL